VQSCLPESEGSAKVSDPITTGTNTPENQKWAVASQKIKSEMKQREAN
jgi:hypothetical protein